MFIKRMLNFLRHRVFSSKQRTYYFFALILAITVILAFGGGIPLIASVAAMGFSGYLYFVLYKFKQKKLKATLEENLFEEAQHHTIHTGGGNYNESVGTYVERDYINIQNTFINMNQDEAQIILEIGEILTQLRTKGYSVEETERKVAADLATEMNKNHKVKKRLTRWTQHLGGKTTQNSKEVARKFVRRAAENSPTSVENSNIEQKEKYKKLCDLLKAEKWEEADKETVRVIAKLMPGQRSYLYIEIDEIPPKDLKIINDFWVKYSDGRFGFSVQQRIWKKALKLHLHRSHGGSYSDEDSALKPFVIVLTGV